MTMLTGQSEYETDLQTGLGIFRDRVVGTQIRRQTVDAVELLIDTHDKTAPFRYFLQVVFSENPPNPDDPPEANMLNRVFSDVPRDAGAMTTDRTELVAWMLGTMEPDWLLDDERI